jgi:hypothetical protein
MFGAAAYLFFHTSLHNGPAAGSVTPTPPPIGYQAFRAASKQLAAIVDRDKMILHS